MRAGYRSEILGKHAHTEKSPSRDIAIMLCLYIYICNFTYYYFICCLYYLYILCIYLYIYFLTYMYKKQSHQNFCFRSLKKANLKYDLHNCMFFPELQNMKIESMASILYINYY